MRVCPKCSRKNKPRAKFCDQCGSEFVGFAGSAASTQCASPKALQDRLPPGDTAKGIAPGEAGVPLELRGDKGVHRQTQKIDGPPSSAGAPSERASHNQQTIKVARVPAPAREGSGPTSSADPEPEATIQGAFYLRKQEAGKAASAEEHVGWLVETLPDTPAHGAIWPVTAGMTYIGSSPEQVGTGVTSDRSGLAPLHALIFHREGVTWILDLASPTPVRLNGEQLSPLQGRTLAERDELRLGELVLSFRRIDPQT